MNKSFAISLAMFFTSVAHAESDSLATQAGRNFGVSLSAYQYNEPNVMSLQGRKLGLDLQATRLLQNHQFLRGELRYAGGVVDYTSNGTGSASGNPDLYLEARGLIGKDWEINNAVLASYVGVAYRYLYNDERGSSCDATTCYWGYRRESNYIYLPIGFSYRAVAPNNARWVSTLEYDHLLAGRQVSRLSDGGQGDANLTNRQTKGYGWKLSVMFEQGKWSVGPFVHYWNIAESDKIATYKNGVPDGYVGYEPSNNTNIDIRQRCLS
jgi:hypothetical protein